MSVRSTGATDVIFATYSQPDSKHTVLTLYQGLPFQGARTALLEDGSYQVFRAAFEKQTREEILPLLGFSKSDVIDIRMTRWGHPMPTHSPGLILREVVDQLRKPYQEKIFFVQQDNWALPAFEVAASEALYWSPKIKRQLETIALAKKLSQPQTKS